MAANQDSSFFWDKFIPFVYSFGASIVVIGALGKIMHYSWASFMLPLGLGIEAVIFLIYAFQSLLRPSVEYQWEKVYPELADDYKGELPKRSYSAAPTASGIGLGLTSKMDEALASANITPDIFSGLKTSFQTLNHTVSNLNGVVDASSATAEYSNKLRDVSGRIGDLNGSLSNAVDSLINLSTASKDAQEYRVQFQKISQNLGALNAVYELELQDTNKHLKSMNAFYTNLSSAMQNMSEASKDTQQFKNELNKLTNNLASLNNVYGSMLSAMKGNI